MTIRELLAEESPTLRRRLASLFSGLPDETPASPLSCAAGVRCHGNTGRGELYHSFTPCHGGGTAFIQADRG